MVRLWHWGIKPRTIWLESNMLGTSLSCPLWWNLFAWTKLLILAVSELEWRIWVGNGLEAQTHWASLLRSLPGQRSLLPSSYGPGSPSAHLGSTDLGMINHFPIQLLTSWMLKVNAFRFQHAIHPTASSARLISNWLRNRPFASIWCQTKVPASEG